MFRLAAKYFGAFHFKAQPGALRAPGGNRGAVKAGLLRGQGGVHQVIDQPQHIGAVARTHQRLRIGGRMPGVIVSATGVEQITAAAGTNRDTHCFTTSTCQNFPGWPRTWH
ncbi:hypothetical protein D3C84_1042630 [compost metagenome]